MQFSLALIQYIPVSSQDVVLPVPPLVPGHAEDFTQVNENNVQWVRGGNVKCVCLSVVNVEFNL